MTVKKFFDNLKTHALRNNFLAKNCNGDIIFPVNDDMIITTNNWDKIIDDEFSSSIDQIKLVSLKIQAGTSGPQIADLVLNINNEEKSTICEGSGPVDAIFNSIRNLFPHKADLQLYQVHAVTQGTDAQAEVSVRLHEDGKTVVGRGADTDTLVASARAYIGALNRLIIKREKANPDFIET